jgi:hypothetical protein
MRRPRLRTSARRFAGVCLAAAPLVACGETSVAPPVSTPSPTARPLQACTPSSLPETGFVPDDPHSGVLNVGRYSPNGDIQAALIYFRFETGKRHVYTNLPATPAAGAATAGPAPAHDLLIICDAIQFAAADGAQGFVHAFRQQRLDQKQQEITVPKVGDGVVAFKDHDQSFIGYAIQGTNAAELATSVGNVFYSVSVFGPNADVRTSSTILASMMGAAR